MCTTHVGGCFCCSLLRTEVSLPSEAPAWGEWIGVPPGRPAHYNPKADSSWDPQKAAQHHGQLRTSAAGFRGQGPAVPAAAPGPIIRIAANIY